MSKLGIVSISHNIIAVQEVDLDDKWKLVCDLIQVLYYYLSISIENFTHTPELVSWKKNVGC